ncbi:MAG: LPS export ABC transporter periplasmic protein LptC [Pseudomonadota bacterium]
MNVRGPLIGAGTLLVAVVVLLLLNREQSGKNQTELQQQTSDVAQSDYYMEGVISRHFDANGKLSHVLQAPRIDYFLAQQQSLMQQPHIQLFGSDGTPWDVRAAQAIAEHQQDTVTLREQVWLERGAQAGVAALRMETDQLTVKLSERRAHTDAPVRFRSSQGEVKAVGLTADFANEKLHLLAQVKGHYENAR